MTIIRHLSQLLEKVLPSVVSDKIKHQGFQRYFKNTGWMFFGQIFSLASSFFVGVWIARYLGPQDYGVVNYAVSFVGIFGFLNSLGIGSVLYRDLLNFPEQKNSLLGTSFLLLILSGVTSFLVIVIASFIFEKISINRLIMILYSSSFIFSATWIIQTFFQSRVQAKKNIKIQVLSTIFSSVLKIILIFFGGGIVWLTLIFVLENAFNAIGNVINYYLSGFSIIDWRFDFFIARRIISSSWLLMLVSASDYIFFKIDQVVIRFFMGDMAVGLYAVAVKIVEVWYFVPTIICSSLLPAIINSRKRSLAIYYNRLNKLLLLLLGLGFLISILITLLSPFIIDIFFGDEYIKSINILKIYIWSNMGLFLGWGLNQYFLSENKLKMIFYFSFGAMSLNIFLNFVFIPVFGLNGAALATLISYSVCPTTFFIYSFLKRPKRLLA